MSGDIFSEDGESASELFGEQAGITYKYVYLIYFLCNNGTWCLVWS